MSRRYVVELTEAQLGHVRHAVVYSIEFSFAGDWHCDGRELAMRERALGAIDAARLKRSEPTDGD